MDSLRGTPNQGLYAATLGFFIGFAAVSLFGPTASKFKEVMQLSPVAVGLLVAAPALSGSLFRIPFSAWVDTTGGRKPFLVLLTLSILGMLGLFLLVYVLFPDKLSSDLYPLILLLGVLCGCGIATFSVGISQVAYWFPQSRQGWALGTYAGVGNLAPGMISFVLPFALGSLGLAGSYLVWLIFLLLGTILYFVFGRNAYYFQLRNQGRSPSQAREMAQEQGQEIFPASSLKESLSQSAKVWKTWALVAIYFTTFGGFIALTAWFPTFWQSFFATGAVTAGILTAMYSLLTSAIRIPGGSIADHLGGERTAMLALLFMLIGAAVTTISSDYSITIVAVILMALGMGICNAAVFKLVPQEVPKAVGGAAGWVGGLGAFGGFAIPPIMGLFVRSLHTVGYARGFSVFVFLAIMSLSLAFLLKQKHTSQA